MLRTVIVVLLILGCGHVSRPQKLTCDGEIHPDVAGDPQKLHDMIVLIRLSDTSMPVVCDGGICVYPCDEDDNCGRCDRQLTAAIYQLGRLRSEEAARLAAALVLDKRMEWDGGAALAVAGSFAQIGPVILPYLEPYRSNSRLADRIMNCVQRGERCF
jgi:hypothetical protein